MDFLYSGKIKELDELEYNPPERFEHAVDELVGNFPKSPADGDGQNTQVFESRWPAQFFTIVASETTNSVDEIQAAFTLSTGSGREMGKLAFEIARAISNGMLGLQTEQCHPE